MRLQNHPGPSPGQHASPGPARRRGQRAPPGRARLPRHPPPGGPRGWAVPGRCLRPWRPRFNGKLGVRSAPHAAAPAAAIFSLAHTHTAGRAGGHQGACAQLAPPAGGRALRLRAGREGGA